ncbi:MAG TPA: hypothetical protein VF006_33945 [Longimicrobium sp.]
MSRGSPWGPAKRREIYAGAAARSILLISTRVRPVHGGGFVVDENPPQP